MQTLIKNYNLSIAAKIILFGAFFITIASGCFQLQFKFPFIVSVLGLLSKIIFILSFVFHVIICLRSHKPLINGYDCVLLLYFTWTVISSVLNGHSWITQVPFIMKTLTLRFLLSLSSTYEKQQILEILSSVFSSVIYANLFFLVFLPGIFGYYEGDEVYLVSSNYNQFGAIFLPAIFIKALSIFCGNKKICRLYPLILICLLSVVIAGSATASVSLLCLLISIIVIKNPKLIRTESLVVFISILLFFATFVIPTFSFLDIPIVTQITEGLGKDMTFSRRTTVWAYAVFQILHSPIFGYGVCNSEWYQFLLNGFLNPHNIVLHILMHGGIVGLIIFMILVIIGLRRILSVKNDYSRSVLTLVSVIFLLMSQFEVYNNMFIYTYILFMYISKDYVGNCQKTNVLNKHQTLIDMSVSNLKS